MSSLINWSLIGISDHQGVFNVGGRVGAAKGPDALRHFLKSIHGKVDVLHQLRIDCEVAGLTSDVAKNHQIAAETIAKAHLDSGLSIVIGGGHDHGYSHCLGLSKALQGKKLGCINIDSHLDVRKPKDPEFLITSGSPFYLALEAGVLSAKNFVEFGAQSHCNSVELWNYIKHKKVKVVSLEEARPRHSKLAFQRILKNLRHQCDVIVVSLDLDAIASAFAPGVSAPQADGFSPSEIMDFMELAGNEKKVVSLGIFELNPEHDRDNMTAKLAATATYKFLQAAFCRSSIKRA